LEKEKQIQRKEYNRMLLDRAGLNLMNPEIPESFRLVIVKAEEAMEAKEADMQVILTTS